MSGALWFSLIGYLLFFAGAAGALSALVWYLLMSGSNKRDAQPLSPPSMGKVVLPNGQMDPAWLSFMQAAANRIGGLGGQSTFDAPFTIDGDNGSERLLIFTTGGGKRWALGLTAEAEQGGATGSDFVFYRFDDSDNMTPVLSVDRETQKLTVHVDALFQGNLVVAGHVAFNNGVPVGPIHIDPTSPTSIAAALVTLGVCKTN